MGIRHSYAGQQTHIDECFAARVVIRVTDGLSLVDAMARSIKEAKENRRDLGAIAIDSTGAIAWGKTSQILLAAYHTGHQKGDTLQMIEEVQTV